MLLRIAVGEGVALQALRRYLTGARADPSLLIDYTQAQRRRTGNPSSRGDPALIANPPHDTTAGQADTAAAFTRTAPADGTNAVALPDGVRT